MSKIRLAFIIVLALALVLGPVLGTSPVWAAPLLISDPSENRVEVAPDTVAVGEATTITATGDNQNVGEGMNVDEDDRYVPVDWTSTEPGKSGVFDFDMLEEIYTSSYTSSSAGTHTITASFERQIWTDDGWQDSGDAPDTKTTTLIVTGSAKPHRVTITATVEATDYNKKVPVAVDEASETAEAKVDERTLAEASSSAALSGEAEIRVVMPVVPGARNYTVEVPAGMISSETPGKNIEMSTGVGTLIIPGDMYVSNGAIVQNVSLTLTSVAKNDLSTDLQALVGARPIIELGMKADGRRIMWRNESAPVTVSVPYVPTEDELSNPDNIVVWYIDGSGNAVAVPNGHYDPVAGTVTFTTTHFSQFAAGYNSVTFQDVSLSDWYGKAVNFMAARGLAIGAEDGNYGPGMALTRGECLAMIMKALGIASDVDPKDNFSDAGNTYYTGYLAAAKRLGISAGVGDNRFEPNRQITRQEMFVLLYNTTKYAGRLPQGSVGTDLSAFSDANETAPWAKTATELLAQAGIVGGSGANLCPLRVTTRAEMAQVLYNLLSR